MEQYLVAAQGFVQDALQISAGLPGIADLSAGSKGSRFCATSGLDSADIANIGEQAAQRSNLDRSARKLLGGLAWGIGPWVIEFNRGAAVIVNRNFVGARVGGTGLNDGGKDGLGSRPRFPTRRRGWSCRRDRLLTDRSARLELPRERESQRNRPD